MSNPLDASKAVLYGQVVQAVTAMYLADPTNLTPPPPPPTNSHPIPAGWKLSAWINMSDFDLQSKLKKDPEFYGIVVHQIANPTHRIVAIRGTEGKTEWLDDATSVVQVPFTQVPNAGMVALGFDLIYSTLQIVPGPLTTEGSAAAAAPKLTGSFAEQLDQLATHEETHLGIAQESATGRLRLPRPTVVTGHSLGSALATLFVLENSVNNSFNIELLSTLASPKVGNLKFKQTFDSLSISSWRIVNTRDLVPQLPASLLGIDFEAVNTEYSFDSGPLANLGCYHIIETYLHLLDSSLQITSDCIPPATSQG